MNRLPELPQYPPMFFVKFANAVRRTASKISRRFTHPNVAMLEYMQNLWILGAISTVNELGIADILRSGPRTISELATLTGTCEDPLYRIMRMLASEGIFRELTGRRFRNTGISESMQEKELKFFVQHTLNSLQFKIFGELMHSVKTGRRVSELFLEKGVFEHIGGSEQLNDLYNNAMTNTSRMQVAAVLSSFNFRRFTRVVDVGGGKGFFITALLAKYKKMHGTLFDLPQVTDSREKQAGYDSFDGRLKIVSGNFFDSVPDGGDLYTLKNILHGWNDEECMTILRNIRKAMLPEGKIMIIEVVVEGRNKPSWGKMSDIFMMAGSGGRERTKEEFSRILELSGCRLEKIKRTVSPLCLVIASPA